MHCATRPDEPPCPCGGGPTALPYAACCARWHAGPQHLQAPDAPTLMRSRYSAYVVGRADYLADTWHPSTRPERVDIEPGLRWLGLQLRASATVDADHATVDFVARSKGSGRAAGAGRAQRLAEHSRFVREAGRWFYVDGDAVA